MVFGRKGLGATLAVLAAFLLLVLASVLAAPAWAETPDDNPIDGSTVDFTRDDIDDEITQGIIDVSEFESCEVDEGATITVEDDDGTQAVFEDLEGDDGNALTANSEIDYDDNEDEIVIDPLTGGTFITPEIITAQGDDGELDGDSAEVIDSTGITCEKAQGNGNGAGRGDRNVNIDDRDQENTCNQVVTIVNEDVQNNDVDNSQDDEAAIDDQEAVDPADPTDGLAVDEVTDEQIVDIAQELNVSPVIVQTCIQQNAGRDTNINSNNAEENIDEEFDDEEVVIEEESDDGTVAGDQYGGAGVIGESIPDKLLPNTGGVSPFAVLAALGFALLLAGLSAGYAVARRGS